MTDKNTLKFTVPCDDKENMRRILRTVFDALQEKGYNPINQIVGYLLTEDPTNITNYNNARSMICKLARDEHLQELVRCFLAWSVPAKRLLPRQKPLFSQRNNFILPPSYKIQTYPSASVIVAKFCQCARMH